jgi:hypothetical protein
MDNQLPFEIAPIQWYNFFEESWVGSQFFWLDFICAEVLIQFFDFFYIDATG